MTICRIVVLKNVDNCYIKGGGTVCVATAVFRVSVLVSELSFITKKATLMGRFGIQDAGITPRELG